MSGSFVSVIAYGAIAAIGSFVRRAVVRQFQMLQDERTSGLAA